MLRAAKEAGVASLAPWTLYDFADGAIPANSAVSTLPAQYKFGLRCTDGTPKLAASVVRTASATGMMPNSVLASRSGSLRPPVPPRVCRGW